MNFTNFTLSTTFPRREFTDNDSNSTLYELELVPNAVILVLPLSRGTVTTNSDNFYLVLFWSFVTPFLNAFRYVKNLIYGTTSQNPSTPAPVARTEDSRRGGTRNESIK